LISMRFARSLFVLMLVLVASAAAFAASDSADLPHVHVRLMVLRQSLTMNKTEPGGLYFKLEPGWHVYWKNPGDAGEPPHIQWTLPMGSKATPLQFPVPKRLPLGPLMDFGYEDEVMFPFDVVMSGPPGTAVIHAKVDWLVCRATCIPEKAELEVTRTVTNKPPIDLSPPADTAIFNRFAARLPKLAPPSFKPVFQPAAAGLRLQVKTGQPESSAEFFPADPDIIDNPAPQKVASVTNGVVMELKKDANASASPAQLKGVLTLSDGRAFEITAVPGSVASVSSASFSQPPQAPQGSGGGAAPARTSANSTPQEHAAGGSSRFGVAGAAGLAFLGGLLLNLMPCVFPVLFLKGLALVRSGNEERHNLRTHGYVYTLGILVSFWVLVALLLGLRAAGATLGWGFQFQSPAFLWLMASLLFFLGLSLAGQFELGLTLTSAGGSLAAKQGYTGSFFTGVLAVIVATPCSAPFMGTAIGYALAQPAAVTFVVFTALALGLAAPYVLLTMQPAWTRLLPRPGAWMDVLKQAISVPIFGTVIWLAWVLAQAYGAAVLAALLAGFLLLAVAGWFLGHWPAKRWATAVASLIVVAVVVLGVFAPGSLSARPDAATTREKAGWEPWSAEAVSRYQAQGRPVFVDFTASWCLSCQVNERVALSQPDVQKAFSEANVALLRADWTRHDETITHTLEALGRSGVPAYALYSPGASTPQLLPEVLTPGIVLDALARQRSGAQNAR
jgi:thiol:disulfide interchange protein DsbD